MSRFVIKLGTSTLTDGSLNLSLARMVDLVRQVCELRARGHEVVLVSSGAMAAGRAALGFPKLPKAIPAKQMLSAVGQPRLMETWGTLFAIYDVFTAQVLLTRADLASRRRYLNARSALWALLQQGVVPVINENDTVATEEIRVGDNDNLSALVATLIHADTLVLLTDQDGLYVEDPRKNPAAALIDVVDSPEIPEAIWKSAGGGGALGTGGMRTKLEAADLARRAGIRVVIARGNAADILLRIADDAAVGTQFLPTASRLESFKRFILAGSDHGSLAVDAGAGAAIRAGGSLLPAGIVRVEGDFERGSVVMLLDENGSEIARGLVNYDGDACRRVAGLQSSEIDAKLGYYYGDEVIHRDNLVMLKS